MADAAWLRDHVRDIADFPSPGILFKDITPLLAHTEAFRFVVDSLAEGFAAAGVDAVVGIEARGFILAAPVAHLLGAGFIPVRKAGKLPWDVRREEYALEYGTDLLEIHSDAVGPGDRVAVVDDVIATGGTAAATCRLVEGLGATVAGLGFVIELAFLDGRARLDGRTATALLTYE